MNAKGSLHILAISVFIFGCHHQDTVAPAVNWGINSSGLDKAALATGSIDMQNNGPHVTYDIAAAYVSKVSGANVFKITFKFTSTDSLMLIIAKNTNDYNYHFPASAKENQLLYVVFDRDTLELSESAVSIQPRSQSNTFSTVTNIHTSDHGDFNGTIENVILLLPSD